MQTFNTYYTTVNEFLDFITKHSIEDSENVLVQIFTSINDEKYIAHLLYDITSALPSAQLIGTTTDGEIFGEQVTTSETVISVSVFEKTSLRCAFVRDCQSSKEAGIKMANQLRDTHSKLIITFTDGLTCNGEEYLKGLTSVASNIKVAGGMAGDGAKFEATYVFTKDVILKNGAVGVSLCNETLQIFTDYSFNWLGIGKEMKITHAIENRVYTIDDICAYEVYKKYLGEETAKGLPSIGIEYPLVITKGGESVARAVLATHEDGSLTFAGNIAQGESVHFGYGDPISILDYSLVSQKKLLNHSIESIFIYSCMARRRFMPKLIEKEIEPFSQIAPTAGFFTYGEFFSAKEAPELLNQTMTILALSESTHTLRKIPHIKSALPKLNDYQKSIRALSHLLSVTIKELHDENEKLRNESLVLQTKKDSLNLAQSIGHFGSWDINLLTKETIWSQESYNIYKVDRNIKPTLDLFLNRIFDEDKPKAIKKLEEMRDGKIKQVELRAFRDDGVLINILLNGQMLFDAHGVATRMVGTTLDITELSKLKEHNKAQAQILAQIHDSVVATDLNGNVTHWNNGATQMHEYSAKEMIGKPITLLYPEKVMSKLQNMIHLSMKNGSCRDEITKITKSGKLIYADLSLTLLKDENGNAIGTIGFSQNITQKKEVETKLKTQTELLNYQAYHDHLTNLPNRLLFEEGLETSILHANDKHKSFALLFIDLDNFKEINDTLGHHVGDKVLQKVSKKVSTCISAKDSLSRTGGDEFTVILQNIKNSASAAQVAQKLLDIINMKLTINNNEIYLSASIGISLYPKDALEKSDLIKFADSAMYKAKESGKNSYQFYSSDMTQLTFEKVLLQNSMRTAIYNEEFVVFYQPQVNVKTNKITGMEALVRWRHPSMGLISPAKFIPIAEESGFIIHLDNYVMQNAMKDFVNWYAMGLNPGVLSLNLSIKQLNHNSFIKFLIQTSQETGFNLKWLELEITETQMMQDPLASIEKLQVISDMGIEIAIDDFGTGYSSLAYLKRLPVDKLKIDKSFVDNLPDDDEDCAISKAVIALAKSLNLKIIAEGVETKEQKDFLVENGCFNVQGYYYSQPIPATQMQNLLQKPYM